MSKTTWLMLLMFLFPFMLTAQKNKPDTSMYGKWPSIGVPNINKDGKYVSYRVDNMPLGESTLFIKSTSSSWTKEVIGAQMATFSPQGRFAIYVHPREGVTYLKLGTDSLKVLSGLSQYKTFAYGKQEWIAGIGKDKSLLIKTIADGEAMTFENVMSYEVSGNGAWVAINSGSNIANAQVSALKLLSVKTGEIKEIWSEGLISALAFDKASTQLAFLADAPDSAKTTSIWHLNLATHNFSRLADEHSDVLAGKLEIVPGNFRFNVDGEAIFFGLRDKMSMVSQKRGGIQVDVWHYDEPVLHSQQLAYVNYVPTYLAAINITDPQIHHLMYENERIPASDLVVENDNLVVLERFLGSKSESFWNKYAAQTTFMVDTKSGKRRVIKENTKDFLSNFSVSPNGNFLVYYDPSERNYFCMEAKSGNIRNITKAIGTDWTMYDEGNIVFPNDAVVGVVGWLPDESAILLSDEYDIWKVPLTGEGGVNLTNGEGRKEKIIFCKGIYGESSVQYGVPFLVKMFNTQNKKCGFAKINVKKNGGYTIEKLQMVDYVFESNITTPFYSASGMTIADLATASGVSAWLIRRESATEYPNYFYTTDFVNYKDISNIHPERNCNWLTAELHTFSIGGGSTASGVLYKPHDFDPRKQYPVVIYFYQHKSQVLNHFPMPSYGGVIDYAHFTSEGYLVFATDIVLNDSSVATSALRSVEAAAVYLSRQPWVNAKKIGLNGHSLGGYRANYIITHSKLFAAAISGAGASNLISHYGYIGQNSTTPYAYFEGSGYGVKGTPWSNTKAYVDYSPIFSVDQVSMPVLLFHNKGDNAVPFSQGLEFFLGLRRAGKRAWLLQYDNENHTNNNRSNQIDLEMKFLQFFDHFLKDKPAPEWMTQGIPAKMKGIDSGLELDQNGSCGDSCIVCHPELKKGK